MTDYAKEIREGLKHYCIPMNVKTAIEAAVRLIEEEHRRMDVADFEGRCACGRLWREMGLSGHLRISGGCPYREDALREIWEALR